MEGLPENLPKMEEPRPICLLTNATNTPRGLTTDFLNLPLGSCFRLILRFSLLKASVVVDICFATSYHFGFSSINKCPPLDKLKYVVTTLRNQDNKLAFIQVDKDEELARSSEFMKTCHRINIIVQTVGVDASSLNGKSNIPNKTLANIIRALLLNSSYKK